MKLTPFFEAITPYFEGRIDHDAATRALYGGDGGVDGERLAIYARFCKLHRGEVLALYEHTRAVVIVRGGEAAWERLVEEFFVAHPMRHFELFENGAEFPAWLSAEAPRHELPSWLGELADLEWWRWRVEMAPDAEEAAHQGTPDGLGPLRIAPSVELRAYTHDLSAWLDDRDEDLSAPMGEPAPAEHVVIFWRDDELDGCSAPASPVELAVLKMVSEALSPDQLRAATGLPASVITATLDELHEASILVGEPA